MPKGRTPDFNLWAANDSGSGKCGAAWRNDDGSISIMLDKWAVLYGKGHAGAPLTIKLFLVGTESTPPKRSGIDPKAADKAWQRDDLEDDIPF